MRILLAEDDDRLARSLMKGLQEERFTVDHAPDGLEADLLVGARLYDLIILDRMLPHRSGDALLAAWRRSGVNTPILMLTALDAVADRVTGLRAGADDYLVKPFAFAELLARIEALVRRISGARVDGTILCAGDLVLDTHTSCLSCGDRSVELSATEFRLLSFFMRHPGRFLTRSAIVNGCWPEPEAITDNAVEAQVSNLRKRVATVSSRPWLITRRGLGYMLEVQSQ